MSGRSRKTDRRRGRSRGGVPARRPRKRPLKTKILIVGEGRDTEPNYFHGLKREESVAARFAITVKRGHGKSPESVIEEAVNHQQRAKNRGEDYDEVWCVLDVEGPEKRSSLETAITVAGQKEIRSCLSNPCFEVWLLAHFEKRANVNKDCSAVIQRLNKPWQNRYGHDYQKNDEQLYKRVAPLTQNAIANAAWVREVHHAAERNTADCNSSTEVYRLVRQLLGDSPDG